MAEGDEYDEDAEAEAVCSECFRSYDVPVVPDRSRCSSGDEDEDNRGQPARYESDTGRERIQRRSRTGSLTTNGGGGKGKKYRGRGVQTIPVETRSMGVQVNVWAEEVEAARKGKDPKPSRGAGVGTRQWPTLPTGAGLLPPVTFKVDPDQMAVGTPSVVQPTG